MEQIEFDLLSKEITVQNVFNVSPKNTNFVIVDNECNELWRGTVLKKCKYRTFEVSYMRVVGEPYVDGYMEIQI